MLFLMILILSNLLTIDLNLTSMVDMNVMYVACVACVNTRLVVTMRRTLYTLKGWAWTGPGRSYYHEGVYTSEGASAMVQTHARGKIYEVPEWLWNLAHGGKGMPTSWVEEVGTLIEQNEEDNLNF